VTHHLSCVGGEIVSTFDMPDSVKLGRCDLIEEIMIGEDRLIKFSGMLTSALLMIIVFVCSVGP